MASQITSVSVINWTVCSGGDQRKHQSSASLAFVRGIHRWPVNSPHKVPVTWKMFPFDDVIMSTWIFCIIRSDDYPVPVNQPYNHNKSKQHKTLWIFLGHTQILYNPSKGEVSSWRQQTHGELWSHLAYAAKTHHGSVSASFSLYPDNHKTLTKNTRGGVTKPIYSVPLFSSFFRIVKSYVSYWTSRLYLAGVTATRLRWHLLSMNVIERI